MSEHEIWKEIPHYEGSYQVSNYGRVRGLERLITHSKGGISKIKGRLLSVVKRTTGRDYIFLNKKGKRKRFTIHELVSISF